LKNIYCNGKNLQTAIRMITCRYNVLYSVCGTQFSREVRVLFTGFLSSTQILSGSYIWPVWCPTYHLLSLDTESQNAGIGIRHTHSKSWNRGDGPGPIIYPFYSLLSFLPVFPFLFRTSHTMQQTQQEDSWYSGSRYQS